MTNQELKDLLLDRYRDLLRIQNAPDPEAEIQSQLSRAGERLKKLGIDPDTLRIQQPRT